VGVRSFAAAQILKVLPRSRISHAVGQLCELGLSPRVSTLVTDTYCRFYQVDLDEAESPPPYPSFDAFFTRRLRPGARPIASESLVSPADGQLSAAGAIEAGHRLRVKAQHYDVGELLADHEAAARFISGSFCVVYLAPSDYHRVHSPVDGRVLQLRGIEGDYFPVNAIGERHISGLFVRNQRVTVTIETQAHGLVVVVFVGAYIVGRISAAHLPFPAVPKGLHPLAPPPNVARGDELGAFHLGSTVVLLVESGAAIRRQLGPIRYGESLLS
jgi:phosphatidylserine decarboxylase